MQLSRFPFRPGSMTMNLLKYSIFTITWPLCALLSFACLAAGPLISRGLPLPALDGSGAYHIYPVETADGSEQEQGLPTSKPPAPKDFCTGI